MRAKPLPVWRACSGRAQRGVSMSIIRQQIALAVDVIIWQCREKATGKVRMAEVLEVGHYVEGNIQVRPMFKLVEEGDNPQWEVLSYSSFHEDVLERNGIYLGDAPKFLSFSGIAKTPAKTTQSEAPARR